MNLSQEAAIYITLDSKASTGNYNWEVNWSINREYMSGYDGFYIHPVNAVIPNAVYPVSDYYNRIIFNEGGSDIATTVPAQNYDATTLAAAIKVAMDAAGSDTYTVTYNADTNKLSFSSTGTFYFVDGVNTVYCRAGLIPEDFGGLASTYDATGLVSLQGTKYVQLVSYLGTTNFTTGVLGSVFCIVPISEEWGQECHYSFPMETPKKIHDANLHSITISLRDDQGKPWELPRNMHWSLSMSVIPLKETSKISFNLP